MELMHKGGVDSIRLMAHWGSVEFAPGARDWGALDAIVRETTARGIQPLLFFYGPPDWAARVDGRECALDCSIIPPSSKQTRQAFAQFARDAVARYGPGGDFWEPPAADPSQPPPCQCTFAQPVRVWQVWNEQNTPKYFAPKVNVRKYAKLVKATGKAIKSADPDAEVMLGGMWGPESLKESEKKPPVTIFTDYMKRFYRVKGIKKAFDSLAIHPYSANISGMLTQMREARRVAKANHDRKVGLWITEIGWASGGPSDEPYVVGDVGQAQQLTKAYNKLVAKRATFKLRGIYWYTWRDQPGGDAICAWCGHAGLRNVDGTPKPAWDAFVRLASG
jgi:polysaccharide biosynthesis protein PslG